LGARFSRGTPPPDAVSIGGLSIGWARTDSEDGKGALLAWDPILQRARWRVSLDSVWNGGALATAGGLVFQGTAKGYFTAYDAMTGQRLWTFNAGLGIIASPISYSVHGRQYVSVLVGYGGSASIAGNVMNLGWKYGVQPRLLLNFRVNGTSVLPDIAPPDMTVRAVDDPSLQLREPDVAAGRELYGACAICHGRYLASAGAPAPDLRESQIALNPDSFWAVVHDGGLIQRGMPRFETFTRAQVMQLYAYIRAGAREAIGTRKLNQ